MKVAESNLVYIDDHGLLGSNYYWDKRESLRITEEEFKVLGITDGRVRVHRIIIEPLKQVDRTFNRQGWRAYIRDGFRPSGLYDLAFAKRSKKFGRADTERLMNMEDRPHATGLTVDVVPWDIETGTEVPTRNREDGAAAMFVDFYKNKSDDLSKAYQTRQDFMIQAMRQNGFEVGRKNESFHFNFKNS